MNPQSPREELEIRITALLMGELPPDEAAALQTQIAADAELTALHARLRRAAELLHEASAIPEQPAPPEPARLSSERRERLLAHFKTPPAAPHVVVSRFVKPRRDWKWAVPIGLAASLIALIGGAVFVNGFGLRKEERFVFGLADSDGDRWASQPGMIRVSREKQREGLVLDSPVDALQDQAKATHRFQSNRGTTARTETATNNPAFFAGSSWDTSRVQTHFDRTPPPAGGAGGAGVLYLPPAAPEETVAALATGKPASGRTAGVTLELSDSAAPSAGPAIAGEAIAKLGRGARLETLSEDSRRVASNPVGDPGIVGGEKKAPRPDATPPPMLSYAWGGAANSDPNQPADLFARKGTIAANTAKPVAESVPEPLKPAAMEQAAAEGIALPGLQPGGGGGPALADGGKKADTFDFNGNAGVVLDPSVSSTGGLTKTGNGKLVFSGANAYAGGTVISGGTLRTESAATAAPEAKDNLPPANPTPQGRPAVEDNFAYYKKEGESPVVLGTAHRGLGVVTESDLKDVSGPKSNKPDDRTSPATTFADGAFAGVADASNKSLAWSEEGRKREADKRGEMLEKLEAGYITKGVKNETTARPDNGAGIGGGALPMTPTTPASPTAFALGDQPAAMPVLGGDKGQFGDVRVDYGIPLKETAGSSPGSGKFQFNVGDKLETPASEDGRKPALEPRVADFDGFINYGSPIPTPPTARPGISATSANTPLVLNGGGVANESRTVTLRTANPEGDRKPQENPVVGRIAFWNDDDTSKVNNNPAGREANVPTREPSSVLPKDGADLATVSGVITGTGAVTLNKAGAGNWQLDGASTFTGTTTVNGGTLILKNKGAASASTAATDTNALTFGGTGVTNGTFAGVATKSGQRASGQGKRDSNSPVERPTPEISKTIGAGGGGTVSKAGDGTLSLGGVSTASGGINVNASDVRRNLAAADEAPRKLNEELSKDPHNTAANNVREEAANLKDRSAGADPARATATGEANQQSTRAYRLLDRQAKNGKDDAAKKGPASVDGLSVLEPFAETEKVEAKLSQAMQKLQDGESDELRAKSNRPNIDVISSTASSSSFKLAPAKELKRKEEAGKQMEKKLAEQSLVEAEKEEAKKVVEQIRDPEPAAPKPAPNPLVPQPEIRTGANAFSTFSLNVSDVAFKLAGASLEHGTMPDVSTLRSEEFINAFDYRDPEPAAGAPLGFVSERARYPFAQNRDLLRLSVKTAAAGRQPGRPLNIVLLIDNSGSMERADRVRILREGLRVLSAQLQPQDKLSIVTFARTPRLWADGVTGDKAGEVTARVGEITPEGGTNLAAALDLGYTTALRHYQAGSINHVVVLTDGAANLGNVDPAALKQKVEAHRKQGVALDCFGIGWEGLNDDMLEQLSRNGDGRYGFINTPEEAAVNFAGQLAGALRVAASDVKVQVEWNPKRVTAYRQVGYAKHQLTKEQFRDNTVDAAEIGAAESGNALYVVEVNPRGEGDLATVRVRFKVPGTSDYREHEWTVPFAGNAAPLEQASSTLRLAATASAFSEMLASSPFATEVTSDRLLSLLNGVPAIYGADPRPKKLEWMIRQAKSLSGR